MTQTLLKESDVKIVYDHQGVRREVVISYQKYQEILDFIERYTYFYSDEVQERLRRSEEDLEAGRYTEVKAGEIDKALEWLNG